MRNINIDDIDFDLTYEGYIWYSNKTCPEKKTKFYRSLFTDLPFIIEGNLYSRENEISISIKNIDGQYLVKQWDLKDLPKDQITKQTFIAHNLDGENKIEMIQFWEESAEDNLLEGMKTLIPSWRAFVGFKKD